MADSFTPTTTVDDSQFQGIISVYTTQRTVPLEMPLPNVGDAVTSAWGDFTDHVIIARGSTPRGDRQKTMWVMHLHVPASLAAQDAYNFSHGGGDSMSRFYVMRRSDYLDAGYPATIPAVGTPDALDALFPNYVFATESVSKIGSDPNSIFVALERVYMLSPKVAEFYDDDLDTDVFQTTEVIPAGTGSTASGAGYTVEIQPGNHFYELRVTTAVTLATYPRQLASIPADIPYRFPALLRGVSIVASWAWAQSAEAAPAYDEAYYFDFDIVEPTTGPYEARVLRFLTADPDSLRDNYPIQKIVTQRETIGISRAWFSASNLGNSAFAEARQIEIPPCIHGDIEIEHADTLSVGQNKTSLPSTPNFAAFAAMRSMIVGYEPRKTRYGLYEVQITEINCTGVYSGNTVPMGSSGGSTGAGDPPTSAPRPDTPTATVAAGNTSISGITSPFAEVTARNGTLLVGRTSAIEDGTYVMTLSPIYTEAVALIVRARRGGTYSLATPVTTFDLAPTAPSAHISADLATVAGRTQPEATVNIVIDAVAQVETATVLGTITADGNVEVIVTSAILPVSPLTLAVPVLNGDVDSVVAGKIEAEMVAHPDINEHYIPADAGADVTLTTREEAMNDPSLNIAINNGTAAGLTPAPTSADTVPGRAPFTVTADSNGDYTYTFDPVLDDGDELTITATDAGGTSPATIVTASATPPTLASAAFPTDDYDTLEGVASVGAKVIAYFGNEEIGDAVADGSGDWSIDLDDPYIRGEVIQVVAVEVGAETIRSASIYVTAADLNLEQPVFVKTSIGYTGTVPDDATAIVIRKEGDPTESFATIHANGKFVFELPGKNGERYEVVARYAVGDSDPVFVAVERISAPTSYFSPVSSNFGGEEVPGIPGLDGVDEIQGEVAWFAIGELLGYVQSFFIVLTASEENMLVNITFPGQERDDIELVNPGPVGAEHGGLWWHQIDFEPETGDPDNRLPRLCVATITLADGRVSTATFDRSTNFTSYVMTSP
jgi:hypothetical protein